MIGGYLGEVTEIKGRCITQVPLKKFHGSDGKKSACNAGDLGSIPELGRSPEEGNGNSLQILAWKIPGVEEPGRLQSMGS